MPYAEYPACRRCKQALPKQAQGRPREHCRSCATAVSREKEKARLRRGPTAKTASCLGCGIDFDYTSAQTRLYCAATCKPRRPPATADENKRRWAEINADPRKLAAAREKNRRAKRDERNASRRRRVERGAAGTVLRPSGRTWTMGYCRECGKPFVGKAGTCCSRRCARKDVVARRNAAKSGAFVERVFRAKVYERDGWVCGICGDPVDREQTVPHPLAPTLDHIIPLAGGGEHSYSNVQTAHFICNSRKRDLVLDVALAPPV